MFSYLYMVDNLGLVECLEKIGNGIVSERSTNGQISLLESASTYTLFRPSFALTMAKLGIWTLDVLDLSVNMIVDCCVHASHKPMTLKEPTPNNQHDPLVFLVFCINTNIDTTPLSTNISYSIYIIPSYKLNLIISKSFAIKIYPSLLKGSVNGKNNSVALMDAIVLGIHTS